MTKPQVQIFTTCIAEGHFFFRVHGDAETARDAVHASPRGRYFAFQYPSEESAGTEKWHLTEILDWEAKPTGEHADTHYLDFAAWYKERDAKAKSLTSLFGR